MVRIRLPPPGSHEQIEPSGELTTGRKQTYSDGRGTDGSNPIPSSGESGANLIFGGPSLAVGGFRQRQPSAALARGTERQRISEHRTRLKQSPRVVGREWRYCAPTAGRPMLTGAARHEYRGFLEIPYRVLSIRLIRISDLYPSFGKHQKRSTGWPGFQTGTPD